MVGVVLSQSLGRAFTLFPPNPTCGYLALRTTCRCGHGTACLSVAGSRLRPSLWPHARMPGPN